MRIERLRITAYGGIADVELEGLATDAPTVILGENEAGKSTCFHAIESLLYGFSPASIGRFPYRPWESSLYPTVEGDLALDDGRTLRVQRRLAQRAQGILEVDDVRINLANRPLPMLKHVARPLFASLYTLHLESLRPLSGATAEALQDRLLGELAWGDLRAPREVALELEQEAARLWRADRRGRPRSRQLREEIDGLLQMRRGAEAREEALRVAARQLRERKHELERVEGELAVARAQLRRRDELEPLSRRVEAYAAGLFDAEWDWALARPLADLQPSVLRVQVEAITAARDAVQTLQQEWRSERQLAEEAGRPTERQPWGWGAAFGGALTVMSAWQGWPWLIGIGGGLLVASLLLLLQQSHHEKRRRLEEAHHRERAEQLAIELQEAEATLQREQHALQQLLPGLPLARRLLEQADLELFHRLNQLRAQVVEVLTLLHTLPIAPEMDTSPSGMLLEIDTESLRTLVASLERRRSELLREVGRLEEQVEMAHSGPTLGELDGELATLRAELHRSETTRDRLLLEAALLRMAEARYRREHQPDVLRRASEYLREITAGRYTYLTTEPPEVESMAGAQWDGGGPRGVDEGDEALAGIGGEEAEWAFDRLTVVRGGDPHPLSLTEPLSRGTLDQVFLAFRLAALDHLDEGDERLPVLIDEALIHWDPQRLDRGLRLLGTLAARRQILLFTCHPRLAERAAKTIGAQVIPFAAVPASFGGKGMTKPSIL